MDIEDDSDDEFSEALTVTPQYCIRQAGREGLTLVRSSSTATSFVGVFNPNPGWPKPYKAELQRDGKKVHLGYYAIAEYAALAYARALGVEGSKAAAAAAFAAR